MVKYFVFSEKFVFLFQLKRKDCFRFLANKTRLRLLFGCWLEWFCLLISSFRIIFETD